MANFLKRILWPAVYGADPGSPDKHGNSKAKIAESSVVRASTEPIETSIKFEWNIQRFDQLYPNPNSYDMFRNILFKKLESPSFTVRQDDVEMPVTKWHVQLICDEEPSAGSMHFLEISLKLAEFGKEGQGQESDQLNSSQSPGSFIWQSPKEQFAVRCKIYLVNPKEEIIFSETMAKTMSLARSKCGILGFTTLEELWKEKIKYFPDDILRIRVDLTVIWEITSTSNEGRRRSIPPKLNKLGEDLSHLLKSQQLADVTITCDSKTFLAHKQILAARCTFFERMFGSNMKESSTPHTVDIVDIDPDSLYSLLYYLYTGCVNFELNDVGKLSSLVVVADKYGLGDLKEYCFDSLLAQINLTNAGDLAVLAFFYSQDRTDSIYAISVRQFCHANWDLLKTGQEFKQLVQKYPGAFVRNL